MGGGWGGWEGGGGWGGESSLCGYDDGVESKLAETV